MRACIHLELKLSCYLPLLSGMHQVVSLSLYQPVHVLVLLSEDLYISIYQN